MPGLKPAAPEQYSLNAAIQQANLAAAQSETVSAQNG